MSLPHALLGLISYQPKTGYEIKALFENSIHYFWNATLPQIYRTLNQMKDAGWLSSQTEHQEGKPSRKVYTITDDGRVELLRWLEQPVEAGQHRHTILVKVFFGRLLGADKLAGLLRDWLDQQQRALQALEEQALPSIEQYRQNSVVAADARFWKYTLDFGIAKKRAMIEWGNHLLEELRTTE